MSTLLASIDAEIEKRSLLKHPFYKSWSAGALSQDDLAIYSQEYFQMVKAVPEIVRGATTNEEDAIVRDAIDEIQREEAQHVELWERFAGALGIDGRALAGHAGSELTTMAIAKLKERSAFSLVRTAAIMYAIEKEQPKISRTKLDGLEKFYGMDGNSDGTIYFREHESADVRHAAVWRGILSKVEGERDSEALDAAILSLQTQNAVLDSVMRACAASCER